MRRVASDIQTLMVTATKCSRVSLTKWNENICFHNCSNILDDQNIDWMNAQMKADQLRENNDGQ